MISDCQNLQKRSQCQHILIAFVVADFACEHEISTAGLEGKTLVSVCAKPTSKHDLKYALNISRSILEYFERIYDIKYPLPKIGLKYFINSVNFFFFK